MSTKTKRKPESAQAAMTRLMRNVDRRQKAREAAAGPHRHQWEPAGTVRQVTSGERILKRPRIIARFFECSRCGKSKHVQ